MFSYGLMFWNDGYQDMEKYNLVWLYTISIKFIYLGTRYFCLELDTFQVHFSPINSLYLVSCDDTVIWSRIRHISSIFSRYSEAFASEYLENIEEMFLLGYYDTSNLWTETYAFDNIVEIHIIYLIYHDSQMIHRYINWFD